MKQWKVTSYFVPDGTIRLRVLAEKKVDESDLEAGEEILWRGVPKWPFVRWGFLMFGSLGALQVVCFGIQLSFADAWLPELFGLLMFGYPFLGSLQLLFTEYTISKEKILVKDRLFRSVDEYDIKHFAQHPDIFRYFGYYRQPLGTCDVKFIQCYDGSMGKSASCWKYFKSVSRSDANEISSALIKAVLQNRARV